MNRLLTRNTWTLGIGTCAALFTAATVPLKAQDFDDAIFWTGGDSGGFMDSANWSGENLTPGPTQSAIFMEDETRNVSVTGTVNAWNVGAFGGDTTLNLGAETTLTLQNDGTLITGPGARLSLVGTETSLFKASTIEAWGDAGGNPGTTEIAIEVELDGGSFNHPVRKGRYALVVGTGGEIVLKDGADVSVRNEMAQTIVRVGETSGPEGVLRIEEGARLAIGRLATGEQATDATIGFLQVGDWGSDGHVVQTGGEVELIGALNIGNQGGHGVYEISGGSLKLGVAAEGGSGGYGAINTIGRNASDETARSSHGRLEISGTGLVELANGKLIIGNNTPESVANNGGRGEIIQNGGTLRVGPEGILYLSGYRSSTAQPGEPDGLYELNSGTLEIGGNSLQARYNNSTSEYAFRLGGGTIRVTGSALTTSVDAQLKAGTESYIDTAEAGATWAGAFTGDGKLAKLGAHTLELTGNSRIGGELHVLEGAIQQTAGANSIAEYGVGTGEGKVGVAGISGGVLNIESWVEDTENPGEFIKEIGRFQVGNYGGEGTFNQTGGVVNVFGALNIGNQGGKGVYNLSAGTLNLVSGTYGVGRNSNATEGGQGELNLSGNALIDLQHGDFIIGDYASGGAQASGVVNQTGGTFRVASGAGTNTKLYLGGYGGGIYHLDDGVLEIGGSSLRGNYGSATAGYEFNLGGGTLRVVDASLVSSVDATLVEGTVSTIDTGDDFDATLGSLSGSGDLVKEGKGRLYLTGDTVWSGNQVDLEGGLRVGSSNAAGSLTLEEGATVTLGVLNPSLATNLRVGIGGNRKGVLNIDGGHVLVKIKEEGLSNTISIGRDEGNGIGDGELIMSSGSIIFDDEEQIGTAYGSMAIGQLTQGKGVFQHSGGEVKLGTNGGVAFLVGYSGGEGTYNLSGDAEFYNGGGTLYIGNGATGRGTVNLTGQARFTLETANSSGQIFLGHDGGEGNIIQDGAGTELFIYTPNPIHIGTRSGGTESGGTGTYELKAGTGKLASDRGIALGEVPGGVGIVEQSGGVLYVNQVEGQMAGVFSVGHEGEGRFTQSGGESHFGGVIKIAERAGSKGEVHLEGGIMGVGGENGISAGPGDAAFYFKGGTLKVEGADLTTSVDATLSNTSTIDTGGLGAEWSGLLSGLGGLKKTGEGVLTLTRENTYQGTTTVEEGTLAVNGTAGTGALVVERDGALAGTGVIRGHATIAGALNPGNSPGKLTFDAGLTLTTDSTTTLEITGFEEGEYDQIDVSGGAFLVEGGTLVFSITGIGDGNHTFDFFEGTPITGDSFDVVQVFQGGATFDLLDQGGGLWTYSNIDDPGRFYSFNVITGELDYQVVPEPETWALLVGAGAALWLARRRRTRNAHA
ncbi:MAG TPA: autotransporter-associated beta strand repeat-containing protein [Chthoniobacteraceae bacterium]|nr:autotransporter-associated beta strand repeat-containing protein [Chthoniobacteraceae bacterium]